MVARGAKLSAEQQQKMADGRKRAKVVARIVGFPVDSRVRVNTPQEKWFDGKTGTVSEHNLGEVGVRFTTGGATVWFLPETLVRIFTEKRSQNGG